MPTGGHRWARVGRSRRKNAVRLAFSMSRHRGTTRAVGSRMQKRLASRRAPREGHMPSRVMVVDDDPDIREVLWTLLREEGYEMTAAGDGEQALRMLESGAIPDLAIVDLMMPVLNGWQLIDQIRKRTAYSAV